MGVFLDVSSASVLLGDGPTSFVRAFINQHY